VAHPDARVVRDSVDIILVTGVTCKFCQGG
jgi:hypothetical protein